MLQITIRDSDTRSVKRHILLLKHCNVTNVRVHPYKTENGDVSKCQETVTTVYILVPVKVYKVRRLHGSLSRV